MNATFVEAIGSAAAILTTLSFLPQTLQVLRTRNTAAISLTMYAMFTLGLFLWGVYGILTRQWPVILANAFTLVFALIILAMKLREVLSRSRG
jgi:MtN3 and saliva related transmembrane protein